MKILNRINEYFRPVWELSKEMDERVRKDKAIRREQQAIQEKIRQQELYRQQQKQRFDMMKTHYYNTHYQPLALLLDDAIVAVKAITSLVPPDRPSQLYVGMQKAVVFRNGIFYCRYRGLLRNKMRADTLARILQAELNNLCSFYGFPQVVIKVSTNSIGNVAFWLHIV